MSSKNTTSQNSNNAPSSSYSTEDLINLTQTLPKKDLASVASTLSKEDLLKLANTLPKPTRNVHGISLGWPESGGIWVLRESAILSSPTANLPVVKTMEEHCALLESLGATFYQNPDDCEEVRRNRRVLGGEGGRGEEQRVGGDDAGEDQGGSAREPVL